MLLFMEKITALWENTRVHSSWFPPLTDLVEGLTVEQTLWRSHQGGHNIWELVHHLCYSTEKMTALLKGQETRWIQEESFGTTLQREVTDVTQEEWQTLIRTCEDARKEYLATLSRLTQDELDKSRPGYWGEFTVADYAMQMPLHDAYHIGQIAMLRSLQGLPPLV